MWAAPYFKTAAMSLGTVGENPLFLLDYALRLLRVVVLLSLWRAILGTSDQQALQTTMALPAVLTYTLISEVFSHQLAIRTTISDAFWEGTVVLRFLRPMGLVRGFLAESTGVWTMHLLLFSVPLVLISPFLGVDPRPATPLAGLLFAVSLVLAIVVGLALEVLFSAITVAMEQPVWLAYNLRQAVGVLLSGSLLPLAYYPWGLGDVFSWLPFAATAWTPLAIYTGSIEAAPALALQLLWALLLWPLTTHVWNRSREKVVGYGG